MKELKVEQSCWGDFGCPRVPLKATRDIYISHVYFITHICTHMLKRKFK